MPGSKFWAHVIICLKSLSLIQRTYVKIQVHIPRKGETNMRFNKIVSGLLAGALAVTSVFAGNVTTVKAEDAAVTPIAVYNFNAIVSGGDGMLGDEVTLIDPTANALNEYTGAAVYGQGRSGDSNDKAVKTGTYGLKLPQTNLGSEYTVSMWVKPDGTIAGNANVLFLGHHSPEKWVGVAGNNNTQSCKVWTNDVSAATHHQTAANLTFPKGEWTMVTLAQSGPNLDVYENGKLIGSYDKAAEALNGANQSIYLATCFWDPSFKGYIDDVQVYNKRLNALQVYKLFDTREESEVYEDGVLSVTKQMVMFVGSESAKVTVEPIAGVNPKNITYSYESSDSSVAKVDASTGEITAVKEGAVTITTKVVYNGEEATAKTAKTNIIVKQPYVEEVKINPFAKIKRTAFADFTIGPKAASNVLANAIPADVKNLVTVEYTSSKPGVATVNRTTGVVTGVKAGYTIITTKVKAKSDGFEMEYQTVVKVDLNMKGITVSAPKTSLGKGEKFKISVNYPAAVETAGPSVTYKATGAVSVKNGEVIAKKAGNGTVIVKIKAGGKSITKKVKFKVGDITGASKVKVKKSITLKVTGISGKATWSLDSKGKKLASINKKTGKLTAKKKTGKVTVTAKVGKVTMKKKITISKK